MPLINTTPRVLFTATREEPYWMPQSSLGRYIALNSQILRDWFDNRVQNSDIVSMHNPMQYRPTLRRIINSTYELGLRSTSFNRWHVALYLPEIDKLMVEGRTEGGTITTRIYEAVLDVFDARELHWNCLYERVWTYEGLGSRAPDYECHGPFPYERTDMGWHAFPNSGVHLFDSGGAIDDAELHPVTESVIGVPVDPAEPRFDAGVTHSRIVRYDGAVLLERYNHNLMLVELEWVGQNLISAYETHGWTYAQPHDSPASNWLMLDPVHRYREAMRWCDYTSALEFIERGWIPVTKRQLEAYRITPQDLDLNGYTLYIEELLPDGSQPSPNRRDSEMTYYIHSITGTTTAVNTYSTTISTGSTAVAMASLIAAPPPVHPADNEFNTRIMQGDRMVDRLKHALLVVTADSVSRKHQIDLPTGEYPVEQVTAARNTLNRFFNAIANSMERLCEPGHDRYDGELMNELLSIVADVQRDIKKRADATDFYRFGHHYHNLPSIYRAMRDEVKTIVHEYMVNIAAQSGYAEFSLRFACEHGLLKDVYDLRLRTLRQRISALLENATHDEYLCNDLLSDYNIVACEDCGEWELSDRAREPYDYNGEVCRTCIDNHFIYSDYYDDYVHRDYARTAYNQDGDEVTIHCDDSDFQYDDDTDEYQHVSYDNRRHLIREYHSAKRHDSFRFIESDWVKHNDRYMGVELEIECRDSKYDAVERLNDALNDGKVGKMVWFENDGSLSSSGFEMISNPMGLDSHADLWEWLQDKSLTKNLRSHDTSTCGLHVHVSRNNLHDLQINRMNVFLNHPDNSALIKAVARRYATNYARIREKQMGKAHHVVDRYDALNLENDNTVEFRIFKGTLKHDSFMAALEFTNAVVNFTAPGSPAGFNLSTERFIRFITTPAQRAETRYLRSYLKEAGFMS